ncbi:MAG: xanthine dehydrogenase family protein subunit M [Burkholderiales bacterium]|nr:xanthine dehydrogenase family protein subunit M [Burkholderiales bacterium]
MRPFELVTPRDSRHAVALLAEHGPSARVLAGGTDLLVELKFGAETPRVIVDLSRAHDLKPIALTAEGLGIGALATHGEIMRSPLIREFTPVLAEAAHTIGAAQTRNLGTLGGNLASGVPSMDSGPALYALEALVVLVGDRGERRLPIGDFFLGPRRTALRAGELLAGVIVPRRNLGKQARFRKFGLRRGQALALVNVAVASRFDPDRDAFVAPRIALGAVAPTVMRAAAAEAFLEGRAATQDAMAEAGRIAAAEAQPISDFRASAGYRRDLVAVLTRRALADIRASTGRRE